MTLIPRLAAAAALFAAAVPAAAQDARNPAVRVDYADLDLATPAGADMLHRRVEAAVRRTYPKDVSGDILAQGRATADRRAARVAALAQVDAAVARAHEGRAWAAVDTATRRGL